MTNTDAKIMREAGSEKPWISWGGGNCPVQPGTYIAYRMRGVPGDRYTHHPAHLPWTHCGGRHDIVSYCVQDTPS